MLNGNVYKSNRYLTPNTSQNILPSNSANNDSYLPYPNNSKFASSFNGIIF